LSYHFKHIGLNAVDSVWLDVKRALFADPELVSARVVRVSQTSITIGWSTGRTKVISETDIKYRDEEVKHSDWLTVHPASPDMHEISPLKPGHTYEIQVFIHSFGKTNWSNILTNTTGKSASRYYMMLRL